MHRPDQTEFRGGYGFDRPNGPTQPQSTDEAVDAIERSRDRIDSDLDALSDRVQSGRERISEFRSKLKEPVRRIKDRPWRAVGIALTVGLLMGARRGGETGEEREARPREGRGVFRDGHDRDAEDKRRKKEESVSMKSQISAGARKALVSAALAAMTSALVAGAKRMGRAVAERTVNGHERERYPEAGIH